MLIFGFKSHSLFMRECRVYLGMQHLTTSQMTSVDLPT